MSTEMKKTVKHGDQQFVFRLPTAKDMIEIDMQAMQIRNGMQGLDMGYVYSQNLATLNHLVTTPENYDFSEKFFYELEEISDEVTKWLNSFRGGMGKKQAEQSGASQG